MSDVGILLDVGKSSTSIVGEFISVDLDVTINESHEWTADATDSPVEIGSPITDHIQEQPDRVNITGLISNAAISDSVLSHLQGGAIGGIDDSFFITRVQTTFDFLRALIKEKKLITLYTRYRIYPNMALVGINIPREAGLGEAINFTAQFKYLRLVETQTVDVPAGISKKLDAKAGSSVQKKTQPQKKAGAQQPQEPPKSKSVLSGILGAL